MRAWILTGMSVLASRRSSEGERLTARPCRRAVVLTGPPLFRKACRGRSFVLTLCRALQIGMSCRFHYGVASVFANSRAYRPCSSAPTSVR